jgi:adenine-specific DNA-methyltransferase
MPNLNWIGKDAVVNHDKEVPFRLLKKVKSFSKGDSQNLIIKGDNLEGLKALMPYYKEKIKCIYIDPPYNTGNENWVYNDKVNSPKIKKWLGKVVSGEAQDLCRHDKWLCMMYPRLKLLRDLLSDDGVIFVSIDENELYNLRILLDEVFGESNFVGQWNWYKSATPPNLSHKIKRNVEYVLCYEKKKNGKKYKGIQKTSKSDDPLTKPQNTIKRLSFPPRSINFKIKSGKFKSGIYGTKTYTNKLINNLIIENNTNQDEVTFENRFIWTQDKLEEEIKNNTKINCSKNLVLSYKKEEYPEEVPPNLIDGSVNVETTEEAGKRQIELMGKKIFDYPKPVSLIRYIVNMVTSPSDIILDSFAGSGTTGHAVLDLNKEDGGNRKFILIEMEDDIAKKITAERIKRAIKKEDYKDGFEFCELDKPLFDENGQIDESCTFNQLATYIYFIETKTNMDRKKINKIFIGDNLDTEYYLIFKERNHNILSGESLKLLNKNKKKKIIYADQCLLSDEYMEKNNIIFKQIPYEIER